MTRFSKLLLFFLCTFVVFPLISCDENKSDQPSNERTATIIQVFESVLGDTLAKKVDLNNFEPGIPTNDVHFTCSIIDDLSTDEQDYIVASYQEEFVVSVHETDEDCINQLLVLLGLEDNFVQTDEESSIELYSIRVASDKINNATLQSFSEGEILNPEIDEETKAQAIDGYLSWRDLTGTNSNLNPELQQNENGSQDNNLNDLIDGFSSQMQKRANMGYFQLTFVTKTAHNFTTDQDIFYLTNAASVSPMVPSTSDCTGCNQLNYFFRSGVMNTTSTILSNVISEPQTTEGEVETESSLSESIGGEVGYSDGGPTATVSGNVTIENSQSFSAPSITIQNQSNSQEGINNQPAWLFNIPDFADDYSDTFEPFMQWIWIGDHSDLTSLGDNITVTVNFMGDYDNCTCSILPAGVNALLNSSFTVAFPPQTMPSN